MERVQQCNHSPAITRPLEQTPYIIRCFQPGELVISPESNASIDDSSQYIRFRYVSSEPEVATTVSLRIHCSMIGESGYARDLPCEETLVSDESTGELMQGLFDSDCLSHMKPETLAYTLQMLCAQLLTARHSPQPAELCFEDWQAKEVTRLIQDSIMQDFSTQEIAGRCGLSACHFSRIFKATYGMPVYQFVLQERIKQAQSRLLSTDDPITEIALDCGFSDQSSFTRRFTAVAGTSPSAWRKRATLGLNFQPHPGFMTASPQLSATTFVQ